MSIRIPIRRASLGIAVAAAITAVFVSGYFAGRVTEAQRISAPRIAPVLEANWTDEQRELLAPYDNGNGIYNVYTTMANYPDLMRDWIVFAGHVLRRNSLPERDREILINRIGWLCQSEYEWAQHIRIGRGVGFTDQDVNNLMEGPTAKGLSDRDRLLMQATDELHKDAFISDATWNALAQIYDTRQLMDIVFTVGEYNLVSMALNSFGVQLDEGLVGFPD